ncbi:MAG: Dabb family protein [Candidatus Nanopelagicales bacterium]
MITHVVMMKLTDPADTIEAVERLQYMDGKIPDLLSIEVLADALHRDGAFDLVLRSTHADEPVWSAIWNTPNIRHCWPGCDPGWRAGR